MKNKYSLLNKATNHSFFTTPFPHLVIQNALDNELYNNLSSKFPINHFINDGFLQNNKRQDIFSVDCLKNDQIDTDWKDFISYHSSKDFYLEVIEIFKKEILNKFSKKFKNENFLRDLNVINNMSTSINTPVKEKSTVRGAHLDNLNKLFTGLFYIRDKDDHTDGGDLELYSWNRNYSSNEKRILIRRDISLNHVKYEKTIKYQQNTFVIFLNSINSLHGVTPRSETDFYRKFCVFTSKLPFSLDSPNILDRIFMKLFTYKDIS